MLLGRWRLVARMQAQLKWSAIPIVCTCIEAANGPLVSRVTRRIAVGRLPARSWRVEATAHAIPHTAYQTANMLLICLIGKGEG